MTVETPDTAVRRRARPRISAMLAVGWLAFVTVAVSAASLLSPFAPLEQDLSARLAQPDGSHLLGTDSLGRDLLARLLHGGQVTLTGVVIGTAVAMAVGVPLGLVAGYAGRATDRILSFVADLFMSVPMLLIILVAFAIFPSSTAISMTIFGLFAASPIFRIIRGATLTIAGELYVTAARAAGLSHAQVLRRHVAPRLLAVIQVQASVVAALALATQVGLGFLGLDVPAPQPSWGALIADGSQVLLLDVWPVIPPTAVICLTILAFGVLGDMRQQTRAVRKIHNRPTTSRVAQPSAPDSGALLSIRGLTVQVGPDGERTALVEDVDIDLHAGEVLGLVGESGAGKSVTARSVLCLEDGTTTTGSIRFDGQELIGASQTALLRLRGKQIGFVGQDPMSSLDPLFRIQSQLVEAIRTHTGASRAEARARALELLRSVRIPEPEVVARKYPFELSGGMAQRVAIALALAGDPVLLIADEPTTALDVTVQMEVLGLLRTLQRERGLAILLVTHDWGVVADMCDRAVTMYAGEIVEVGEVHDVFAAPRHPYTHDLRRSDPHLQEAGTGLHAIPGVVPPPNHRPKGCRFAPRCRFSAPECTTTHPPLMTVGRHQESRCLRVSELVKEVASVHG